MHVKRSTVATLARWRDVVLYATIGATAAVFIAPTTDEWAAALLQNYLPSFNTFVLEAVVAVLAVVALHRIAATRLSHFRNMLWYPPMPTSVGLGILIIPLVGRAFNAPVRLTLQQSFIFALIYGVLWSAQTGLSLLGERVRCTATEKDDSSGKETLMSWLAREEPIDDPARDLFNHTVIAERLLQKLEAGESTVALQGDFGSGKTSIGAIARGIARRKRLPLIFAQVSCWGFGQSIDAQEELLAGIIREVNKQVDTFVVQRLPSEYITAIGQRSSWVEPILRLLARKRNPVRVLQELSPLLAAVHHRVVVFVEDADRNIPTFDISQLEALLVRLREVFGVSFVLCVSPTQKTDLAKLCDQTEIIPPLDRASTLRLIHEIRERLLKQYPVEIMLDSIQPLLASDDDYKVLDWHLDYFWPWQLVLHGLAKTPRILKRALRRVAEAWPSLHGEVHIDDLISVSVLREGAPAAFDFLLRNYRFFKPAAKETRDLAPNAKTQLKESLQKEWAEVTATKDFDVRCAIWLMKELFPASATVTGISGVHTLHRQSMQSDRRGSVYARRLLTESVVGDEISDQRILRLLRSAKTDEKALCELAGAITDSKFASDAFEEFASSADFQQFLPLLSEVYEVIRQRSGARLSRDEHPGFFAPWRLVIHNRPQAFEAWLVGELEKCIPMHLHLLTEVYYFWLGTDDHKFDERVRARQSILNSLRAAWSRMPAAEIANGFDPTFAYTLFHIFFTSDYQKPETVPLSNIQDWAWSGSIVFAAARANPSIILPQVIIVLNSAINRGRDIPTFTLDGKILEPWFGSSAKDILLLIAAGFEISSELSAQEQYLLRVAIEQIKQSAPFYQRPSQSKIDAA